MIKALASLALQMILGLALAGALASVAMVAVPDRLRGPWIPWTVAIVCLVAVPWWWSSVRRGR